MKKIELKNRNRTELCLLGSTIQTADLRLLEVMSDFMKTSKANRRRPLSSIHKLHGSFYETFDRESRTRAQVALPIRNFLFL
jgi:hypothetical protein